jgi:hypothetical protein
MSNRTIVIGWASVALTREGHAAIEECETCPCARLKFQGLLLECEVCGTIWGNARDQLDQVVAKDRPRD